MRPKNKYSLVSAAVNGGLAVAICLVIACGHSEHPLTKHECDTSGISLLAESPSYTVLSQQATVQFGDQPLNDSFVLRGYIIPDQRRTYNITARSAGRIEKLYVRLPDQYITKGEKLLELVSPDLSKAVGEYLFLRAADSSSVLTREGRQKLLLLGLAENELRECERTGKSTDRFTIYSPYDGYIQALDPMNSSSGQKTQDMPGMNGMNQFSLPQLNTPVTATLREGSYISAGQTLFSVNDARMVIAEIKVSPYLTDVLKTGDTMELINEQIPGKTFPGIIELVEPVQPTGQKFTSVRVRLDNADGILKYNAQVKAIVASETQKMNALPSSCIYDLGMQKIVWVKSGLIDSIPYFRPRVVIVGAYRNGFTEILGGLQPGDEIALQGGLMTDRESIIQITGQ